MPEFLYKLNLPTAFIVFFLENLLIILLVMLLGYLLQRRAIKTFSFAVSQKEYFFASLTLILNTLITFVGFWLWKNNYIVFHISFGWEVMLDFFVLFLVMDLAMYFLHLFIHNTALYKPVHGLHHEYHQPSPIDLFVLNPMETLSFGSLWLILIFFYPCNIYAVVIYLTLNVFFGMIGHLSVEPFPEKWLRIPFFNLICTSTFHYQHHQLRDYNFGFYTVLWDKLFGTLAPDYEQAFISEKQKQ